MNAVQNSVQLTGRIGQDPEMKVLPSGKKLAKMSIAISETFYNTKGERVTETQWHNLVAWNKQAETAEQNLKKGDEISIEGRLSSRSYIAKDGVKKYITEVVVNTIEMSEAVPAVVATS